MKNSDIIKRNNITDNLQGMDIETFEKLDLHVTVNGGLSTEQLMKTINFHKFTVDSLTYLFNQINTHRCTYHGIGPFLFREGGWYNIREKKIDVIKKLTDENIRLKHENNELNKEIMNQTPNKLNEEIERLNKELSHLKEVLDWKEDILTC
jgi:hypothetical protein